MPVLIKREFARLAGVSPQAISKGLRTKILIQTANKKIDTEDPINKAYIENHLARQRIENFRQQSPEPQRVSFSAGGMTKIEADILRINAQTAKLNAQLAEQFKILISRDLVSKALSQLASAIQVYFIHLGDRLAPSIADLCGTDDAAKIQEIKKRIDAESTKGIEQIKAQIAESIKAMH